MSMQEVSSQVLSLVNYPNRPFTGYYLGSRTFENEVGIGKIHTFQMKKDSKRMEVFGFGSLNNILSNQIPSGTLVEVTYTGKENKKTKRGMQLIHMCVVKADFDDTIESTLVPEGVDTNSGKGKDYSTPVQEIVKGKPLESAAAEDDDLPF